MTTETHWFGVSFLFLWHSGMSEEVVRCVGECLVPGSVEWKLRRISSQFLSGALDHSILQPARPPSNLLSLVLSRPCGGDCAPVVKLHAGAAKTRVQKEVSKFKVCIQEVKFAPNILAGVVQPCRRIGIKQRAEGGERRPERPAKVRRESRRPSRCLNKPGVIPGLLLKPPLIRREFSLALESQLKVSLSAVINV